MKNVAVIGAGFAGLSSACFLAEAGMDVTVVEKNSTAGGRARQFAAEGFVYDMGPSWYWMPDVFERFFNHFGKTTGDYYQLKRLDPSYRVYFGKNDYLNIPAAQEALAQLFEKLEPGSSKRLDQFLAEGKYKYELGMTRLVYRPGLSLMELADMDLLKGLFKLHVFQSVSTYARKFFREPRLLKLLEFPVLFLGGTADNTPALYTLMNYADMKLGTWYPQGGMYKIIDAMTALASELSVKFRYDSTVAALEMNGERVKGLKIKDEFVKTDYVIAGADYNHVEQHLLPHHFRQYSPAYWQKRVMAPSSLIFYLGINKKVKGLLHHTLFFDEDFSLHANEIYRDPKWPTAPQFYVSCPSKTDATVAPPGFENLMILMPVAAGLHDDENTREKYFDLIISRLETMLGEDIRSHIIYKRSYAHNDFVADYNAFRGNAYGLANTLMQTANLKPSIKNNKVKNLFYTGQLTVPGPGVPPAIISGQVTASALINTHNSQNRK